MPGTGGESPTDFNECVSKNELQKLVDDQRNYIDGKFDELMRTINGLVTRVEHVEQRPPHGDTDANLMRMMTTRMRMPTLMLMLVLRTVFGTIVKVWEVIKIVVIMILLLKPNLP